MIIQSASNPPPSFNYVKHTNVMKLMKEKVPLVFLSLHSLISNILYSPNFVNDTIQTVSLLQNITSPYEYHPEKDRDSLEHIFWVFYPLMCCLCFGWEFFHSFHVYKLRHPHYHTSHRNQYAIWSSVMSVCTFIIGSYYLNNGRPFSRFFKYNYMIATILFYIWTGILWVYTHVEQIVHNNNRRRINHSQITPAVLTSSPTVAPPQTAGPSITTAPQTAVPPVNINISTHS